MIDGRRTLSVMQFCRKDNQIERRDLTCNCIQVQTYVSIEYQSVKVVRLISSYLAREQYLALIEYSLMVDDNHGY